MTIVAAIALQWVTHTNTHTRWKLSFLNTIERYWSRAQFLSFSNLWFQTVVLCGLLFYSDFVFVYFPMWVRTERINSSQYAYGSLLLWFVSSILMESPPKTSLFWCEIIKINSDACLCVCVCERIVLLVLCMFFVWFRFRHFSFLCARALSLYFFL